MALHIELIVNFLNRFLQANVGANLVMASSETDPSLPITAPNPNDYFIGEPSRIRAYNAPSVFLIVNHSRRPLAGTADDFNAVLYQEHAIYIDVLTEATDEQELTRQCWRYAQAFDATLNERDIRPSGDAETRATLAFVRDIDYGVLFTTKHPEQRVFRKDILLDLLVKHWETRP